MNRYGFDVHLTPQARQLLRLEEAVVLDWHRMAICCAGAGEMSLYAMEEEKARGRKGLVRLKGEDPLYAARAIFPHLAGREVIIRDPALHLESPGRLRPALHNGMPARAQRSSSLATTSRYRQVGTLIWDSSPSNLRKSSNLTNSGA